MKNEENSRIENPLIRHFLILVLNTYFFLHKFGPSAQISSLYFSFSQTSIFFIKNEENWAFGPIFFRGGAPVPPPVFYSYAAGENFWQKRALLAKIFDKKRRRRQKYA